MKLAILLLLALLSTGCLHPRCEIQRIPIHWSDGSPDTFWTVTVCEARR